MALENEGNTDLAFDTGELRTYAGKYNEIAVDLREMVKKLNTCLNELKNSGWTTPAGSAFQKMSETNWEKEIEKYASLLETLSSILTEAAGQYDGLVANHIDVTKL